MVGKNAFWQALIFTVLIFSSGILLGVFLESYRSDKVQGILLNSEISLLDEQLMGRIGEFNVSCSVERDSLFDFADRIYHEARMLETYDSSSKFSDELKKVHRQYDLLRFLLWAESSDFKNRCGADFHTIVYFYDYASDDVNTDAIQSFYGNLLSDLKNKYPSKILLIPIAANMNLTSISTVLKDKQITSPSIYIDNALVIKGEITFSELENATFSERKTKL